MLLQARQRGMTSTARAAELVESSSACSLSGLAFDVAVMSELGVGDSVVGVPDFRHQQSGIPVTSFGRSRGSLAIFLLYR